MKIEAISIDALRPYENNARLHQEKDINAIVASIEEFGFNDPVGVWKDNIIVEGHGRYEAAKILGIENIPCIRLDHLNDEERKAYAIAHNSTASLSGWNFNILDEELEALGNFEMEQFGFNTNPDVDLPDEFFDAEEEKNETKKIQCPECGEWFEV